MGNARLGEPPYLLGVGLSGWSGDPDSFPHDLPFVRDLDLTFRSAVTFFVGENGSGKSTLLEGLAAHCRLPVGGGSRQEIATNHAPENDSPLARALRPRFRRRPIDGFFLRAETHAHFATLLEAREDDPDWRIGGGSPYRSYGGRSLHRMSHGEAFLAVVVNRLDDGIFLLDEPEAALSPQRQLALLVAMHDRVANGAAQFVVATHSPILMTYPGAQIVSFDGGRLHEVELRETDHYRITREMLEDPETYWKYLLEDDEA